MAEPDIEEQRVLDLHVPEFAFEIVGRILRPNPLDHVDVLDQHARLLRAVRRHPEQFRIGRQASGADPEDEASATHVIELRGLGRDMGGVPVWRVDDAGGEFEPLGAGQQVRHEHQRRRIRLGARR